MKRLLLGLWIAAGVAFAQSPARTDGMWLPVNVGKLNFDDMKATGLQLGSAAAIYNEQEASLKDAIVKLDGGSCTAEAISGQGLLLTNHHCAYDGIAALSTVEHDYLTNGFWAMKIQDELPMPGHTAAFLLHSEDVTTRVRKAANVQQEIAAIVEEATKGNPDLEAEVKPMFFANDYYLFVYEVFRDVRLVGCPPSSIGKFGGDTDNWMWPRHTGDFSMLRVYANANNKPADYAADNKPYQPKQHLKISLKGVKEGDYSMIMGYPGRTERYLTASAIQLYLDQRNADRVLLLGTKTAIMKRYMDADNATRIALASDYASQMNYYKYLIGQTTMLKRYDITGVKKAEENAFQAWADKKGDKQYTTVVSDINTRYKNYYGTDRFVNYLNFSVLGSQTAAIGLSFYPLIMSGGKTAEELKPMADEIRKEVETGFKGFKYAVDQDVFAELLILFHDNIAPALHPQALKDIMTHKKAKKGKTPQEKIRLWTSWAYSVSFLSDPARATAMLELKPSVEAINADPLMNMLSSSLNLYREKVVRDNQAFNKGVEEEYRRYVQGQKEMQPARKFFPDANSTMRITYGKVMPYEPADGVFYKQFTTLDGVIAKENPDNEEFVVPTRLHELWAKKDYGQYAENGKLMVGFLTTNDITGGNSGSPTLNARGELIGVAFDGNWESMCGDIYVIPELKRTIVCDIRYVLFVVDKFAGCTRLISEMDIVK